MGKKQEDKISKLGDELKSTKSPWRTLGIPALTGFAGTVLGCIFGSWFSSGKEIVRMPAELNKTQMTGLVAGGALAGAAATLAGASMKEPSYDSAPEQTNKTVKRAAKSV